MFEQTFVPSGRTNKPWTVIAAFGIQGGLIAIAILIPLIYFEALPQTHLESLLVAPPPPPPPPPPPAAQIQQPKPVKVIPRQFDLGKLVAPKTIPKKVAEIKEEQAPPPPSVGVPGGVAGGVPGGQMGGVFGGIVSSAAPPPPPPPPAAAPPPTPQRIRVGGNVQAAKIIAKPMPEYPPLAKQARIQGTVRLTAIIGKDGTVQNLQVASGHPLLVPAALQAVKQWRYQPTTLNGSPVEVVTEIDVNFNLAQ